jgi:hypothetical protein
MKHVLIAAPVFMALISGASAQDFTASAEASTPVPVREVCGSGNETVAQAAACWAGNGSASAQLGASEGGSDGDSGGDGSAGDGGDGGAAE